MKDKILILGTVASGKTFVARKLAQKFSIPIIHVDQIEFNIDLTKKDINQIREEITNAVSGPRWILDGHGPLDLLPMHLKNADMIVFLDFSFVLNILWLVNRQLRVLFFPRRELPKGSNEWKKGHFKKMYETLKKQHRLMNPELLRILNKPENRSKLIHIKNREQLRQLLDRQNLD